MFRVLFLSLVCFVYVGCSHSTYSSPTRGIASFIQDNTSDDDKAVDTGALSKGVYADITDQRVQKVSLTFNLSECGGKGPYSPGKDRIEVSSVSVACSIPLKDISGIGNLDEDSYKLKASALGFSLERIDVRLTESVLNLSTRACKDIKGGLTQDNIDKATKCFRETVYTAIDKKAFRKAQTMDPSKVLVNLEFLLVPRR